MMIGLRVVRGPDWIWGNQDGGEGSVGTVVHSGDDQGTQLNRDTVLVCWDNGHQANYRTGHSGAYDLKVVESSFAGVKHARYTCNECAKHPVEGMLWHCGNCYDYDLCTPCYMADKHNLEHCFQRRDNLGDSFVSVGKRLGATKVQLKGIFKDAKVCRGRDWEWGEQDGGSGREGRVINNVPWSGVAMAGARVSWGFLRGTNNYRVGYTGKVDLKCTSATSGGNYYVDHLPKLGEVVKKSGAAAADESKFKVGDRVVINLDAEILKQTAKGHGGWVPGMEKVIGKVGVVQNIHPDGDILARWDIGKWTFHPVVFTKVKVQQLRAGDKVRVIPNKDRVMALQEGHGGWNESMTTALGQEGHVLEVDGDGDAVVVVGPSLWLFNSEALVLESEEKDRRPEGERSGLIGSDIKAELVAGLLAELILSSETGPPGDRLVRAAARGDLAKVKEILQTNPDKINHKNNGKTALHVACHQGKAEVVSFLLSKGANKNELDEQDYTALHHGAYGDDSGQTVQVMLNNGANVNANNNNKKSTPLHLAVAQDKTKNVEILVKFRHTDVNIQDSDGDTPLHNAILKNKDAVVNIILNSPNLDVTVCNSRGFNPLHLACLSGCHHGVTKLSETFPGLVDIPKEDGFTALHLAAYNNHVDNAKTLLLTGHCNVNFKTNKGQTALMLATERGYTTLIELLVENGTDINAEDEDGDTALHFAVMVQSISALGEMAELAGLNVPMVKDVHQGSATACYLALHGADLQHHNHSGKTPLSLCVDPAVRLLLQQFAQTGVQTSHNEEPRPRLTLRDTSGRGLTAGASSVRTSPAPVKCTAAANDPSVDKNLSSTVTKDFSFAQAPGPPPPLASSPPVSPTATVCIICEGNIAAVTFKPCGHRITCTGCSIRVKRCLSCQTNIEQKISPEGAPLTTNCLSSESYVEKYTALQERLHQIERGMECIICMERRRCIIFQCGHGTCGVCADRLQVCHLCKETITNKIQMY